jgi:heme-degrading monooxygenase HmoA
MYVILWEFRAKEGREKEFEKVYGAHGDWALLFRRGEGYRTTELWADPGEPRRFITLDRWESREAYESFRRAWRSEFEALDRRCEAMTDREVHLGSFDVREADSP